MQINGWLCYQLENSATLRLVLKKNKPEEFPFYMNKQRSCISCSIVCKIIFRYEVPDIADKAGSARALAIEKCYAFHAKVT